MLVVLRVLHQYFPNHRATCCTHPVVPQSLFLQRICMSSDVISCTIYSSRILSYTNVSISSIFRPRRDCPLDLIIALCVFSRISSLCPSESLPKILSPLQRMRNTFILILHRPKSLLPKNFSASNFAEVTLIPPRLFPLPTDGANLLNFVLELKSQLACKYHPRR